MAISSAETLANDALAESRKIDAIDVEADLILVNARLCAARKEFHVAFQTALEAIEISRRSGYTVKEAEAAAFAADAARQAGDRGGAKSWASEAARLASRGGAPYAAVLSEVAKITAWVGC
jgi:hypothetical protein